MFAQSRQRALLLAVYWSLAAPVWLAEAQAKEPPPSLTYLQAQQAFDRLTTGMDAAQVQALLGAPDRRSYPEPPQNWYDVLWTYDFKRLPGFPHDKVRSSVWSGEVMFMRGKIIHLRKQGWLE